MAEGVLYDLPGEFLADMMASSGTCDAQSILPSEEGNYVCHCTCDNWDVVTDTSAEGLKQAREHTRLTDQIRDQKEAAKEAAKKASAAL
jgi:hypothetical protein